MWEKFKESRFAEKCRQLSRKKGAVVTLVCLLLAMTVILSVSIATNRTKKKYLTDDTTGAGGVVTESNRNEETGEIHSPDYKDTNAGQVGGDGEDEFSLELPVSGSLYKKHDSTIQVWSDTMGDYRVHLGIDIATAENAPVYAAADGVISRVWDDALMGRCVAVSHDGQIITIYKNLSENLSSGISEGVKIKCGQQIGTVGSTAIAELADDPHIHMEMTVNGLAVDPLDYFSREAREALNKDEAYESNAVESESKGK